MADRRQEDRLSETASYFLHAALLPLLALAQEGESGPGGYLAKCRDIWGFITSCMVTTGTSLVEARCAAQRSSAQCPVT